MKLWWRGEPLSGCSLVSKQEMMCGEERERERERKEEIKKKYRKFVRLNSARIPLMSKLPISARGSI
jgi:hypothetical protein